MKAISDAPILVGASVVVIAAIGGGLLVLGSPSEERSRRVDERRVSEAQAIAAATDLFWTNHSELPESLARLVAEPGVEIRTTDPVTFQPYEYVPGEDARYELCLTFELASGPTSGDPTETLWSHGEGRHCFQLEAEQLTRSER